MPTVQQPERIETELPLLPEPELCSPQ